MLNPLEAMLKIITDRAAAKAAAGSSEPVAAEVSPVLTFMPHLSLLDEENYEKMSQ